jgi:hypothetical protein
MMRKGQQIMENILRYEWEKGEKQIFPCHPFVKSWWFKDGEEAEATLANSLAIVAEKNGLSSNDMHHLFPAILRMMKSDIEWSR